MGRKAPINPDNFLKAKSYSVGSTLDLGAGNVKLADTTVDIDPTCEPDVIHNLEEFPYPFEDNSYDTVWGIHLIEHLENDKKAIEEMKRIAKERVVVIIPIGKRPFDNSHKRIYMPEDIERLKPSELKYSEGWGTDRCGIDMEVKEKTELLCPRCLEGKLKETDNQGTAKCDNCGAVLYGGWK